MNKFEESLKQSLDISAIAIFNSYYKRLFCLSGLIEIERITDIGMQKRGIDVILHFERNLPTYFGPDRRRFLNIDEKIREEKWDDILIEIWSNAEKNIPGWACKEADTDYIFYCFRSIRKVLPLYFPALRQWIKINSRRLDDFPLITAKNPDYHTYNRAVPISILQKEVSKIHIEMWDIWRINNVR